MWKSWHWRWLWRWLRQDYGSEEQWWDDWVKRNWKKQKKKFKRTGH
jgi:hypothetical protein